ncbi:ABC transporter substrate-binding protein [Marinisporobacter balticus]|uniref:Iron(III) transport system substrate-binding protein n=1 Tax=Marinisporobacter balticus TaxID=2018667 RepID=A0A4R2KSV8_9FIRM|nr:ABC transporter substrate-binding protein [Marinisporobacter balticus]TCO76864.1 iron(III) transport system substrate-binding protein [Marinisporobacter balticus]
MKKIIAGLIAVLMIFSFSGCKKQEVNSTNTDSEEMVQNKTIENDLGWSSSHYDVQKMKDVTLNMYGVTDTIRLVLDQFQEDTGIKVENLTMKNGEILQRLKNEKDSGVNIADIWFTGGADTFINAAQSDLLVAYQAPEANALEEIMKDKNGYWHGTSLTLVNWVVNKQLIEEKGLKMPETWEDLLQEELKGEVSMPNPASSGTAYNVVSAILQTKGNEEGWKYLEKLIEQVPFFTARGSDPARMVVNGEAIVGINASNGDRELEKNNAHIQLIYPKDGTGWWPQPVAIVKGTNNLEASKVFVDWILSKRGMETLAKVRNAAVARTDVEVPKGIVDISDIKLFMTDFQANAQKREEILAEWEKHVAK